MKRIAFFDTFNGDGAAEQEISKRLKYCFNKCNVDFVHLYNDGKTNDDTHIHADNLDLEYCYAHEIVSTAEKVLPDCFNVFFHWAPLGFNGRYWCDTYLRYMNKFDIVVGGYETQDALYDIINNGCNRQLENDVLYNITSSISKDFILPPIKKINPRLFYIGINIEAMHKTMRYGSLIKYCDKNDLIDIYGPNKSFGRKGCWDGYKCYRGSIPLDGYSIIKKINQAGICLALNSPAHNAVGSVSNRTYEAAAAGAIIISDDNPYVRKYFGDSVFYVDVTLPEDEQISRIKEILEYIKQNPEEAYQMACKSQEVFVKKLALDEQVAGLTSYIQKQKEKMNDISLQTSKVDVICYVDSYSDWKSLQPEIEKQYYKNLHLIIVSDEATINEIKLDSSDYDFVIKDKFRGKSFCKVEKLLQGEFFIMLDNHSAMHRNHIYKAVDCLKNTDSLYCYSGSYIKRYNKDGQTLYYETINSRVIEEKYLLSSLNAFTHPELALSIEKNCPTSIFLFKRDVLNYAEAIEYEQISVDLQLYFVASANIKSKKLGKFMHSLTAGYKLLNTDDEKSVLFPHNIIYYTQGKYQNTYIKEMLGIFSKYNIEILLDKDLGKTDKKTAKIIRKFKKYKLFAYIVYKQYADLPPHNDEFNFMVYLNKNSKLKNKLYKICKWL